jgi:hypothetical protein
MDLTRSVHLIILCITIAACSSKRARVACSLPGPPNEELLRNRVQHLELVDAETGEVATYDPNGDPVLEGGQPLALWAAFEMPTSLDICVSKEDEREPPVYYSAVTFSNEIDIQPLGRYDLGSYLLHLSMDGTLVRTLHFTVR